MHQEPPVVQERDGARRALVYAGAAAIVLLVASGAAAAAITARFMPPRERRVPPQASVRGNAAIDQSFFGPLQPAPRDRAGQRVSTTTYRWVDRQRGIVAIPIRRAMELLVEQPHVQ